MFSLTAYRCGEPTAGLDASEEGNGSHLYRGLNPDFVSSRLYLVTIQTELPTLESVVCNLKVNKYSEQCVAMGVSGCGTKMAATTAQCGWL